MISKFYVTDAIFNECCHCRQSVGDCVMYSVLNICVFEVTVHAGKTKTCQKSYDNNISHSGGRNCHYKAHQLLVFIGLKAALYHLLIAFTSKWKIIALNERNVTSDSEGLRARICDCISKIEKVD